MEVTINLEQVIGSAIIALLMYATFMWFRQGYRVVAGILEERKLSRRSMRSRKKAEAQALSDANTQFLNQMKEAGAITDAGYEHWKKKLRSIGMIDVCQETSLPTDPIYIKVTHAMKDLKHRLFNRRVLAEEALSQDKVSELFAHLKK